MLTQVLSAAAGRKPHISIFLIFSLSFIVQLKFHFSKYQLMLVIKILLLEYSSTFYSEQRHGVHDWYLTDPSSSDSHAVSDVALISVITTSLGSEGILASLGMG